MKKLFFLCCVGICLFSCKAQKIYPIDYRWDLAPEGSYFKDSGNMLNAYVGSYVVSYSSKVLQLVITKELNQPFEMFHKNFTRDMLVMRFELKDRNGVIIKSTLNSNLADFKHKSISEITLDPNQIIFLYNGGDCSVGNGGIFISKVSPTQIKWNYVPERVTISDDTCPHPRDLNVYLPTVENLIFTKQ